MIYMSCINSFSHLTLEERRIIYFGIINGSSKSDIAKSIGKDKSTVAKEIKLRRFISYKCSLPLECRNYRKCIFGRICKLSCPDFIPFKCVRRDKSPGCCNGCSSFNSCRFDKYKYIPEKAHNQYINNLHDSRKGVNLTFKEAKIMGNIIKPLLLQGLSPYQILQIHPELNICEKTLYNYIENDVFHEISDITVMDLRRKLSRKKFMKKSIAFKKRADNKYLIGRSFSDYKEYIKANPDVFVTQMDTVYNDESNGPFIQTFKFIHLGVIFAIFHENKTAISMKNGVDLLEKVLGDDFKKHVHVLLTDRGSEFSAADAIEQSLDGTRRTRLFYCDPMRADQKGSLENNHIYLRYILPKGTNLRSLGLVDQTSLNKVLSHINSAPFEKLGGKSPLDMADFMYHEFYEKLRAFGIHKIEKDKVILKPYLLK